MSEGPIKAAAQIISHANYAVAFTGAGISAESGIPTFRDPGGIWDRFDPGEIGSSEGLMAFAMRHPGQIRDFLRESLATFKKAQPNPGHQGLCDLERMGILKSVITQNIDALHTIAGNTNVLEVHGNLYRFRCTSCGHLTNIPREEIMEQLGEVLEFETFTLDSLLAALPTCDKCSGMMRPDVVMFGEAVQKMTESIFEARRSDVIIILGTSGVVYPAAGVPFEGNKSNAQVIEINSTENAFRGITDVYIRGLSGEAMPRIVDQVRELIAPLPVS